MHGAGLSDDPTKQCTVPLVSSPAIPLRSRDVSSIKQSKTDSFDKLIVVTRGIIYTATRTSAQLTGAERTSLYTTLESAYFT